MGIGHSFKGGGGTITNTVSGTSQFSGTLGVEYILRWTIDDGSCATSTDDVVITMYDNPSVASAGADQTVCDSEGATLSAAAVTGFNESGTWSIVSGAGGAVDDVNSNSSSFNGLGGSSYTLRWTVTNGVCPNSTDDVRITVNAPQVATAGADQKVCGTSTFLGANSSSNGYWSFVQGGGTIVSTNSATSQFSGTLGVEYVLRWNIDDGSCPMSTDDVVITMYDSPSVADAGSPLEVCGDGVELSASPVSGFEETGTWSVVAGAGASIDPLDDPKAYFNGNTGDVYTLRWTVSNGVCPISTDDVVVTLKEIPDNGIYTEVDLVSAVADADSYNWYLCDGTPIVGVTEKVLFPGEPGSYYVEPVLEGCSSQSACVDVIITDTPGRESQGKGVYPNPALNELFVDSDGEVTVYDVLGTEVESTAVNNGRIDISNLAPGVYLLKTQDGVFRFTKN